MYARGIDCESVGWWVDFMKWSYFDVARGNFNLGIPVVKKDDKIG
jgi:hypothetical protein